MSIAYAVITLHSFIMSVCKAVEVEVACHVLYVIYMFMDGNTELYFLNNATSMHIKIIMLKILMMRKVQRVEFYKMVQILSNFLKQRLSFRYFLAMSIKLTLFMATR